jgi:hypothetical protein
MRKRGHEPQTQFCHIPGQKKAHKESKKTKKTDKQQCLKVITIHLFM